MSTTARLFRLGKSQAVRIPARFRLDAAEVEITAHDGALLLRPKPRTALDVVNAARTLLQGVDIEPVTRDPARPLPKVR